MYPENAQFLSSGSIKAKANIPRADVRASRGRAAWIPAIFLLEAAAIIVTLPAIGHVLADTGDYRPIALFAAAIWSIALVAIAGRTAVAWRDCAPASSGRR